jgi:hypothetical protein
MFKEDDKVRVLNTEDINEEQKEFVGKIGTVLDASLEASYVKFGDNELAFSNNKLELVREVDSIEQYLKDLPIGSKIKFNDEITLIKVIDLIFFSQNLITYHLKDEQDIELIKNNMATIEIPTYERIQIVEAKKPIKKMTHKQIVEALGFDYIEEKEEEN